MSSKGIKRQVKKENTNATVFSIIWNPIKEEFTALLLTLIAYPSPRGQRLNGLKR